MITGFDPFGKYSINPSWEAVRTLPDKIGDFEVAKLRLLNIYGTEAKKVLQQAELLQPDCILLTGMNSGSSRLVLNTVAVNLRDALIEDNLGHKPWHEPVVKGAPAAYFSTVDVHRIFKELRREHYPVELGYSCGGYICNDVFYSLLHHYVGKDIKIGFVHVPLLPEMVWDETMARPLEETVAVLKKMIEIL